MFSSANIVFFLNKNDQTNDSSYYNSAKEYITSSIEGYFSKTVVYEGIKIAYYSRQENEIGVNIYVRFCEIYQTYINYEYIYEEITRFIDSYDSVIMYKPEFTRVGKIAVKLAEVLRPKEIMLNLEKYFSKIVSNNRDKDYDIDININQILENVSSNIQINEYFLKCHRTTKFIEIDIKLWETRKALACGLSLAATLMAVVTLEECLKTILKNNYIKEKQKDTTEQNLQILTECYSKAEVKFGNQQLYSLIKAVYEEKFINEDERKELIEIKDYIRNAFIHSDKTKIFDDKKTIVHSFKLIDNNFRSLETLEVSPLHLGFAHGIMQKQLTDENNKLFFYQVEKYIYRISNSFWNKWKTNN